MPSAAQKYAVELSAAVHTVPLPAFADPAWVNDPVAGSIFSEFPCVIRYPEESAMEVPTANAKGDPGIAVSFPSELRRNPEILPPPELPTYT